MVHEDDTNYKRLFHRHNSIANLVKSSYMRIKVDIQLHACIEHGHLYPFCNVHVRSSDLQVLQELVLGVEDVQQVVTRLFVHSVHHVLELAGGVLTKHHISCNRQRQPSTTLSGIWRHLQL